MDKKTRDAVRTGAFAYCECSQKYFGVSSSILLNESAKFRYFFEVAMYCLENNIDIELFVEAQFYCLADYFKDKVGTNRLPMTTISTSDKAVERYNRFLRENLEISGMYSKSVKDVEEGETDSDRQAYALQQYSLARLRGASDAEAFKIARSVYSHFKLVEDIEAARAVILSVCSPLVNHVEFHEMWSWGDLYDFLIDLGVVSGGR